MSPSPNQPLTLLPLVALRDTVLFPGSLTPLLLGRELSIKAVKKAMNHFDGHLVLVLQKNAEEETLNAEGINQVGVLAKVQSQTNLPGGMHKITVESLQQVEIVEFLENEGNYDVLFEPFKITKYSKSEAIHVREDIFEKWKEYMNFRGDLPKNLIETLADVDDLQMFLLSCIPFLDMDVEMRQELLEERNPLVLAHKFNELLDETFKLFKLKQRLDHDVRMKMQNSQKEFLIREQIRLLQEELGVSGTHGNTEAEEALERVQQLECSVETKAKIEEEIRRMAHIPPGSPEYATARNYLELVFDLPWGKYAMEQASIPQAKKVLESHHHGLNKVKERILEHLAVMLRSGAKNAPILCLVGPPGVGKTSLARSVAEATGRPLSRVALGGVRDEAEIRGHRKTYIGSMPGRIVDAVKKSKVMNPLILLDELDKMASDYRGDPSAALLEVLDAEQNNAFTDHYLGFGFDLSQVFFIATANVESEIPIPLRDRMEVIRLPGYHNSEKVAIGTKHLFPQILASHNLEAPADISLAEGVILEIVKSYTREAGVRNLNRLLSQLVRKRVLELGFSKRIRKEIDLKSLGKYLGVAPFKQTQLSEKVAPGIVNGLAYTSVGGDVLKVQCALLQGRGRMKLTGSLGEVMKESVHIAHTLVKQRAVRYGVAPELFKETDIHVHFPEGATPKDGPSAGIALVLCLLSAYSKRPVPADYAFTGEVSLSGDVLAIGGLQEKCLGALEAGVTRVFIPEENKILLKELPEEIKAGLKITPVRHIDSLIKEVFKNA